jgi:long-chain acyl-CoA synthetase
MAGYYRKPEATAKAIDAEGWFDTGDLGHLLADGTLVLTGRAKDTIVLSSGENIEPGPLEEELAACSLVEQVMVVGQDRRSLGALIVPRLEALAAYAQELGVAAPSPGADGAAPAPKQPCSRPSPDGSTAAWRPGPEPGPMNAWAGWPWWLPSASTTAC